MRRNVAFLGAGAIASKVAPMLKQAGFTPYAVGSLSNAKEFASAYGFSKFYTNYEELVKDENIDLVYPAFFALLSHKTLPSKC